MITNKFAQNFAVPDTTQSGGASQNNAIDAASTTGFMNNVLLAPQGEGGWDPSRRRSIRWFNWQTIVPEMGTINSIFLKADYSAAVDIDTPFLENPPANPEVFCVFAIEFSTNGGSSWSSAKDINKQIDFSESGSINIGILTSQDLSLFQVRSRIEIFRDSDFRNSYFPITSTGGISNLRLEVDFTPFPPPPDPPPGTPT
jgi:hypothetical protein